MDVTTRRRSSDPESGTAPRALWKKDQQLPKEEPGLSDCESYSINRHHRLKAINGADLRRFGSTAATFLQFYQLVTMWMSKYDACRYSVAGGWYFPAPLRDKPAVELLLKRNRLEEAKYLDTPRWPAQMQEAAQTALFVWHPQSEGLKETFPEIESVYTHGPSLRQLWSKAVQAGANVEDGWIGIRDWVALRPPRSDREWRTSRGKRRSADLAASVNRETSVNWHSTQDMEFPWEVTIDEHRWRVRLNDFPDAYMYSLQMDDQDLGDFHDWPVAWTRAEGPGWIPKVEKRIVSVFVPPTDIAPDRLLHRYQAGECEAVWSDLTRLGPTVRQPPYVVPATAVCQEMARRSRENLVLLYRRLVELDYQFWSHAQRRLVVLGQEDIDPSGAVKEFWTKPLKSDTAKFAKWERQDFFLPLAVRVWLEEVGDVSMAGSHAKLAPFYEDGAQVHGSIFPDPFEAMGDAYSLANRQTHELAKKGRGQLMLTISADDWTKSYWATDPLSDSPYWISTPDSSVDAILQNCWMETTFVGYLRKSFQWGGFPGWERYPNRPEKELAFLREGLLPI